MSTLAFNWRTDREPFGPAFALSPRGMLHRATSDGHLHVRCRGGRPFRGTLLTGPEALAYAAGRPAVLCRYPWCFRAVLEAAGLDPSVGHFVRHVKPRVERAARADAIHHAEPERPHEFVSGWAWCECGRIIVRNESPHRPGEPWWAHKGRRSRPAA